VDGPLDIFSLTGERMREEARRRLPAGAGLAGRLYSAAFRTGRLEPEAHGASAVSSQAWRRHFRAGLLSPRSVQEEPGEPWPTSKAVLAADDGVEIESVRIPMPVRPGALPRWTLCVSSQAGCRMGCSFCQTGRGGLVRNLTAGEIVSQVVTARALLGWECRNIVFMGMGEPLDNFEQVAQALAVLADRRGLALAAERVTMCTCGPAGGITRFGALGLARMNLSVSLNSAADAVRTSLMPVNAGHPLAALAAEIAALPRRRNFVLGVNYCLLPGLNDSREDARRLALYCRGLGRTLVNLIAYNPGTDPLTRPPTPGETEGFIAWMREEGLAVRQRAAKGAGIMAGCGQLGG
jgi:23S rRNA (adenine2503-C2)-methyltransferase